MHEALKLSFNSTYRYRTIDNFNESEEGEKIVCFAIIEGYISSILLRLNFLLDFKDFNDLETWCFSEKFIIKKEKAIARVTKEGYHLLFELGLALECRHIEPAYVYNGEYYLNYENALEQIKNLRKQEGKEECKQELQRQRYDVYNVYNDLFNNSIEKEIDLLEQGYKHKKFIKLHKKRYLSYLKMLYYNKCCDAYVTFCNLLDEKSKYNIKYRFLKFL